MMMRLFSTISVIGETPAFAYCRYRPLLLLLRLLLLSMMMVVVLSQQFLKAGLREFENESVNRASAMNDERYRHM